MNSLREKSRWLKNAKRGKFRGSSRFVNRFLPYTLSSESLEDRQMLDSETFMASFPATATDFGPSVLSLSQFDPQGGYRILDQIDVQVVFQMDTSTTGSLTNNTNTNATYRAQVTGNGSATGPGITGLMSMIQSDTGTVNVPGNSTVPVPLTGDSDLQMESHIYTDAINFALFTGIGTMDYTFQGVATSTITIGGGGNLAQQGAISTTGLGSATLTYTFHLAAPDVSIVKLTNGTDNNSPTGPNLSIGSTVTWTYNVTNPGNVELANVSVVDDQPGVMPVYDSGDADMDNRLDPGETWVYLAMGVAAPGQYMNTGTVTGTPVDANGDPIVNPNVPTEVTASDLDHYFGQAITATRISIGDDGVNEVGQSHDFTVFLEFDDGLPANMFGGDAFDGFGPYAGQSVTVSLDGVNGAVPDLSAPTDEAPADPSSAIGLTDANGFFTVTFTSASAGKVIGNAYFSGDAMVDTDPNTPAPADTSDPNGGSGPAVKRFVDANITIGADGTNPVNAPHVFTITVTQDDGLNADEGGDGVTGFAPVTGASVSMTLNGVGAIPDVSAPSDLAPANPTTVNGVTDASGQFAVTFTSATAGTVTGNGYLVYTLDGLELMRDTDLETTNVGSGPNGSGPAVKTFVNQGHTATIGFWQSKNGRAVILSSTGTNLSNWLSTNFSNLYGSLAGASNQQVYDFFNSANNSYFKAKGTKTNAQVMALALAVYFTDVANTTVAQSFGFTGTLGSTIVSVNGNANAFAGYLEPGGTTISINNMLAAANFYASGGVIYGGSGSKWKMINDQFSFVNELFDIP